MNGEHISAIIHGLCKKYDINYQSNNPHYVSIAQDAAKLGEIYLNLKIILGELKEIEDRHGLETQVLEQLEHIINEINDADHAIIKVGKELCKYKEEK